MPLEVKKNIRMLLQRKKNNRMLLQIKKNNRMNALLPLWINKNTELPLLKSKQESYCLFTIYMDINNKLQLKFVFQSNCWGELHLLHHDFFLCRCDVRPPPSGESWFRVLLVCLSIQTSRLNFNSHLLCLC